MKPGDNQDLTSEWMKFLEGQKKEINHCPPCQPYTQPTICPCCGRPYGWYPVQPYTTPWVY